MPSKKSCFTRDLLVPASNTSTEAMFDGCSVNGSEAHAEWQTGSVPQVLSKLEVLGIWNVLRGEISALGSLRLSSSLSALLAGNGSHLQLHRQVVGFDYSYRLFLTQDDGSRKNCKLAQALFMHDQEFFNGDRRRLRILWR